MHNDNVVAMVCRRVFNRMFYKTSNVIGESFSVAVISSESFRMYEVITCDAGWIDRFNFPCWHHAAEFHTTVSG